MSNLVVVPGRYVFTGQGGGPSAARGGSYDDGVSALLLTLLPSPSGARTAMITQPPAAPPAPPASIGALAASAAGTSILTADQSANVLSAATTAASSLTAAIARTGGPGG